MRAFAAAIENDAAVNEIASQYANPLRVYVGHSADQSLFQQSTCPVVSIAAAPEPYDIGHGPANREIVLRVRCAVYDEESVEDGRITVMLGPERVDRLAHAVIDACKGIANLGDELTACALVMDGGEQWPLCVADVTVTVSMTRGLDFDPAEQQETDNAL